MIWLFTRLLRLHKPAGFFLIFWPCVWVKPFFFYDAVRFFFGALVMRSAGCIINDTVDRDFDRCVERTKDRPLANRSLSVLSAFIVLSLMLCIGGMIWLTFRPLPQCIALLAAFGAILYPFLKRWTYYPQLFLGIIFNSGIWVAWFERHDHMAFSPLFLYVAGIFWTLSYDTSYAMQDLEDDLKIGIKSTAVRFGSYAPYFIALCQISMGVSLFPLIKWWSLIVLFPLFYNTLITQTILGGFIACILHFLF